MRQPQTPLEVVQRVWALREQYPRWGREKLRCSWPRKAFPLGQEHRPGDRSSLNARGVLREAVQLGKASRCRYKRLRRQRELVAECPGALVQMDTKQMALGTGKVVYQFGAVGWFTRKRVMALAPRLTSHYGAESLRQVVAQFPFPALALQSHEGSEFLKEFGATVAQLRLTHCFNGPNYCQGNGIFERAQRTHTEEFTPV